MCVFLAKLKGIRKVKKKDIAGTSWKLALSKINEMEQALFLCGFFFNAC